MPKEGFRFVLEFESLAEFALFVAILRNTDFSDEATLKALTAKLKASTATLAAAEAATS